MSKPKSSPRIPLLERMDFCIACQRDYDAMSNAERALHVCDGEMILRTCDNRPNTL